MSTKLSYRGTLTSPIGGRMPGLTGGAPRSTGFSSSYGSGYTPSVSRTSRASSVPRSPASGSSTNSTSKKYGSSSISGYQPSTYRPSSSTRGVQPRRPLPTGPGPLDSTGRKISTFNLTATNDFKPRSNATSTGISSRGPLKAERDYSSSTYNGSTSTYDGIGGTRNQGGSRNPITHTVSSRTESGLKGRRSASISSLHDKTSLLSLNDDRDDCSPSGSHTSKRDQYDLDKPKTISRRNSRTSIFEQKKDDVFSTSYASPSSRLHSPDNEDLGLPPSGRKYQNSIDSSMKSPSRQIPTSYSVGGSGSSRYYNSGKTGLRNLGNTCFMNSVLQCLSNTQPLLEYCLNDGYISDKNTSSSMKGSVITAYATLMQSMWKNNESSYSPSSFKTSIQRFAPQFRGYSQQDAQEFLRYLLEGLHEDVNTVRSKPKPTVIKDEDFPGDSEKGQEYWRVYLSYDNSRIVDIFVGQLKSELIFKDCGHKSTTFDPFWDLSVPIPKRGLDVSIQQCIKLFMKEEELEQDERPTCEVCKKRKACTKGFSIQRFPQILVLHLKRFSQSRFSQKVTTNVEFPSTLDMTEYSAEKGGSRIVYNLYGVSNHIGSVYSGHYTAYCRHPYSGEWNSFNDARVSSTSSNNVISSEAYLLFYELEKSPSRL